jgi:hypothetical protein
LELCCSLGYLKWIPRTMSSLGTCSTLLCSLYQSTATKKTAMKVRIRMESPNTTFHITS